MQKLLGFEIWMANADLCLITDITFKWFGLYVDLMRTFSWYHDTISISHIKRWTILVVSYYRSKIQCHSFWSGAGAYDCQDLGHKLAMTCLILQKSQIFMIDFMFHGLTNEIGIFFLFARPCLLINQIQKRFLESFITGQCGIELSMI